MIPRRYLTRRYPYRIFRTMRNNVPLNGMTAQYLP